MAVSKRLRFEVLRRDGHACRYCGATAPESKMTIDHVVPESLGGSDDPTNLVTACSDCNGGKSSIPADAALVADVAADAERWSAAIKEVASRRKDELAEVRKWLIRAWYSAADGLLEVYDKNGRLLTANGTSEMYTEAWDYPDIHTLKAPPRPPGSEKTVMDFLAAGLDRDAIKRLICVAMDSPASRKDKWRTSAGADGVRSASCTRTQRSCYLPIARC
jgi:hypothetical protein